MEFDDLSALLEHRPDESSGVCRRRVTQWVEEGEAEGITREYAIGGFVFLGELSDLPEDR